MNIIEVIRKECGACAPAEEPTSKYRPFGHWPSGQRFRSVYTGTTWMKLYGGGAVSLGDGSELSGAAVEDACREWVPIDSNGNTIPPDPPAKKSWDDYPAGSVFRWTEGGSRWPHLRMKTDTGACIDPTTGHKVDDWARERSWSQGQYEYLPHAAIIKDARVLDGIDGIEVVRCG